MANDASSEQEWHAVPTALPSPGATSPFKIQDREFLLCNVDGDAYVVADRCSHANAPLARGRLAGHVLECPLHGGKLDVRDGRPVQSPIRKAVTAYPVRTHDGQLQLSLHPIQQETTDA